MVLAVAAQLSLNFRSLQKHLKTRAVVYVGGLLVVALVCLYALALNNHVPEDLAKAVDAAAAAAKSRR